MGRPSFQLTETQQMLLRGRFVEIEETCPVNPRSHAQFCELFITAVFEVTGEFFSATIYRRLLTWLASPRKPSSALLQATKGDLAERLRPKTHGKGDFSDADDQPSPSKGSVPDTEAIEEAVVRALGRAFKVDQEQRRVELMSVLTKLGVAELTRSALVAENAGLQAKLAFTERELEGTRKQLEVAQAAAQKYLESSEKWRAELVGQKNFALTAIDDSRTQVRYQAHEIVDLKNRLTKNASMTEVFRRGYYAKGGKIPDELLIVPDYIDNAADKTT